jgi:hypothetical protein
MKNRRTRAPSKGHRILSGRIPWSRVVLVADRRARRQNYSNCWRGSMAKAAGHLRMSQPSISEAIANLEGALGVRLLDRSPRGIEPTIYADALLKRGHIVFDELDQGIKDIAFLANPTSGEGHSRSASAEGSAGYPQNCQRARCRDINSPADRGGKREIASAWTSRAHVSFRQLRRGIGSAIRWLASCRRPPLLGRYARAVRGVLAVEADQDQVGRVWSVNSARVC